MARELRIRLRSADAVAALGDLSLQQRRSPEAQASHVLETYLLRRAKAAPRRPPGAAPDEAAPPGQETTRGR